MPYFLLIWYKILGCYREFGFMETLNRFVREIYRSLRRSRSSEISLDVSFLNENLGIGAAPKSCDKVIRLRNLGFQHLIDLRAERRQTDILTKVDHIRVHWVPTSDDWRPVSPEFFKRLEIEVKKILTSEDHAKFLICCGAGEHRAPLSGVLSLVILGHSFETAVEIVKKARPQAELLPVYMSSLKNYLAHRVNV